MSQIAKEFKLQTAQLLDQSTTKLHHCLSQLDEPEVWWRPEPQMNSIGNLILHICGNLRQWTSVAFSEAPDTRDRESEFNKNATFPKSVLFALISQTVDLAKETIGNVGPEQLLTQTKIQGFQVSKMEALLHTTSHFLGHTHQVIMLTRIIRKENYQFQWTPRMGRDTLPM